jgi:hypothetical protein
MEVGYFKVKNPENQEFALKIYKSMVNIVGVANIESMVFDNSHKGGDYIFIFSDMDKINKLSDLFEKHKILLDFQLKTKEYLCQENVHEVFNDPDYREVLNNFLIDNLSVDDVLDKINKSGTQSLNEMDHFVLKTKKP